MDISVGGVDKGAALARMLQAPEVKALLGLSEPVDPVTQVAVFGDAANDVPMFRSIGSAQPALRVAMPHATEPELLQLATRRAQVSDVLLEVCMAKGSADQARDEANRAGS